MPDQFTPTLLRQFIIRHFNLEEVRTLCEDCRVDYEELGQPAKEPLVRELIRHLEQLNRLPELVRLVQERRQALFVEQFGQIDPGVAVIKHLKQALADLSIHEQSYRQRLKERYAGDAAYYIPLAGETTEVTPYPADTKAPRSARRRQLRPEYCEWIQAGQELKRVKLKMLREGVDKYPCLILLGEPGSGKTTALENLAYQFAGQPDRLPLPLRLSEFRPGIDLEAFIIQGWAGSVDANHWGMPELAANLDDYLESGRLFFLFDALNEMPQEAYQERVQMLRRFIDHWALKGNRFLVTCRVLDYGEELSGLQRVEIQPLNDDQIKAFLQNELPQDWPALWQALVTGGDSQRRLLEMARNPYLLTIMIDVFNEDGQLGRNRADLMARFTQILMSWAKAKCSPDEWLDPEVQREALSILAFETQARSGFGTMIKTEQVKAVMPPQVQPDPNWPPIPSPPDQVLRLAARANIIEMPVDRSSVRFYHQLLQEYFAARELLKRDLASLSDYWRWPWLETEMPLWVRPEENYDPLPPPPPTGWEETTILAAGLAAENDDQLVRVLVQINPVLAGRCLYEGQGRVDPHTRQAVIDALLQTIARPEVALRVRIAGGEILGYLGDPRLGEMVTIPAGKFWMGDNKGYDDEKPQHKLSLPVYQLGKYPVTNVEYDQFIKGGGYSNQRWWTKAGWKEKQEENWTEPRYWDDAHFNKPNQPVVGVSWYEGVAYCRWLRAATGLAYRLPTEAEWEKGARGMDGRGYPWGNEFEASRLNSREGAQRVWVTTPVGIYPAGVSPFGAFDCAGNVLEWCATRWGKDYPYLIEDEWTDDYLKGTDVRVWRGGSFFFDRNDARCAYRSRGDPNSGFDFLGFRLVVSPIL